MKKKGARFFSKSTQEVLSPGLAEKPGSRRRKGGKCSGWKGTMIYCHVGILLKMKGKPVIKSYLLSGRLVQPC